MSAIDASKAFNALQQLHGNEMARLAGDIAAKNAFIDQLLEENNGLKDHIVALEQKMNVRQGGADLSEMPLKANGLAKQNVDVDSS